MAFEKVFIHIGLHKTASTFLQESVFEDSEDVLYLTRPYTQCNRAFNKLQYADDSLYSEKEFLDEINSLPQKKVLLISDEAFSGVPVGLSYINRSIILRRFKSAFPQAELLLFIRGQKDLIRSHYNQYIKLSTGTLAINDFVWIPNGNYTYQDSLQNTKVDFKTPYYKPYLNNINIDCFNYYQLVIACNRHFDKVNVILFEELKANRGAVISRLNQIIGYEFVVTENRKINPSISDFQLIAKRFFNRIISGFNSTISHQLTLTLVRLFPKLKFYKTNLESLDHAIDSYYAKSNSQLDQAYPELNLSEYGEFYKL